MIWLEIVVISILSVYTILIFVPIFTSLFSKKEESLPGFVPTEKISVIVPFRNETNNIINIIESLCRQSFPDELWEIIFVDDNSSDDTAELITDYFSNIFVDTKVPYKIIHLSEKNLSGKKSAIEAGIAEASSDLIITLDADSEPNDDYWLKTMAYQFTQQKCDLLIAPVMLNNYDTVSPFIEHFQYFENIAIQAIGFSFAKIKLPFVCSGANLMYRKESFLKANPYKDNKHLASGDDMFLLQSFMDKGFSIATTKNIHSIVYTQAEKTLSAFVSQRLRWASKTKNLQIKTTWFIGILLFLSNLMVLTTLFLALFNPFNSNFCLFTIIYKCIIDFLLLFLGAIMYKQKPNFVFYLPAFLANLLYVPIITIASISVKPSWKGRKI